MKRFILCTALMAAAAFASTASAQAPAQAQPRGPVYATPVGRLLSTPHEMTIAVTAESDEWSGTLLHQQGGNCGFSVSFGGGGGGFGGGFGGF